jgi:hypothetical protein
MVEVFFRNSREMWGKPSAAGNGEHWVCPGETAAAYPVTQAVWGFFFFLVAATRAPVA